MSLLGVRAVNAFPNRVRIIAGRWRGRRIGFPELVAIRPTPDRVRETVFNWLQAEIVGARCLDLFAGTGILGLEALSRGAESVVCVEQEKSAAAAIRQNAARLGAGGLEAVRDDAIAYLIHTQPRAMNIVFVDPPYGSRMTGQACQLLDERPWLASGALIYLERGCDDPAVNVPGNWQCLRSKRAGQVDFRLYRTS